MAWIADGHHGSMGYMARNMDIRFDPRLLLDGAQSIISMAFPYRQADGYHHPLIADYALGRDYHAVIRERLAPVQELLHDEYGAESRICVDSAPILERYWAQRSGVGFIGENHQLIVPGAGSEVFLAELITTLRLESDEATARKCAGCGRCVASCPASALSEGFDARKCRSYLSIEHRGELPEGTRLGSCVIGCDICQRCCPENEGVEAAGISDFAVRPEIASLTAKELAEMTSGAWKRLTSGSAMARLSVGQLRRNMNHR